MSTFAIKGHPTRGSEVIALLEMLGGKNTFRIVDTCKDSYYRISGIDIYGEQMLTNPKNIKVFTLEEFEEKFPYKVGDKVSSKYLKNYKIEKMEWEDINNRVIYKLQGMGWYAANELQPYKEEKSIPPYMDYNVVDKEQEPMEITGIEVHNGICRVFKTNKDKHEIVADKGYEIVQENGKYYAIKKKPKYPKTYGECCKVLDIRSDWHLTFELNNLAPSDLCVNKEFEYVLKLEAFRKLIICRDAYWKIEGDWKPNWNNAEDKYIIYTLRNEIVRGKNWNTNNILVFPTEEMRDAFYENFKDLIETCKELL